MTRSRSDLIPAGVGMLRGEWVGLSTAHGPKELNHVRKGHGEGVGLSAALGTNDLRSNNGDGACPSATHRSKDLNKFYNASPSTPSETSTNIPSDDDGQEFLNDWDEWSEHEVGSGPRAHCENVHYDFSTGKVVTPAIAAPTASTSNDSNGKSKVDHIVKSIPCMPCVHQDFEPREKFGQSDMRFGKMFNAMVSRPVGRKEMMEDPDTKASVRNEWLGQHKQRVYDFSIVREYDGVVAEAKREGKEVHMARVHGICVEKSYQLPKGSPGRKFKGRGVLLGNQVKNRYREAAFFQDLGNSPATFEASRWADFYGFTLACTHGAFSYSTDVRLLPPIVPDDPALAVLGTPPPVPMSTVVGSLIASSICSMLMPTFIDDSLTESCNSLAASALTEHISSTRCRKRNFLMVANTPNLSGQSWLFM